MNKKYIDKLYSSAVEGTCQLLLAQFWSSYAYTGKWICGHKLIFQYFFFNNCLQNIWQKKTPRGMRIFFTLGLSTKFSVCMTY